MIGTVSDENTFCAGARPETNKTSVNSQKNDTNDKLQPRNTVYQEQLDYLHLCRGRYTIDTRQRVYF
jgi:hypothetical protein